MLAKHQDTIPQEGLEYLTKKIRPKEGEGEMREWTETGTTLQRWLVRKHEKIKAVQKQHNNNNNTSTKKTVTNKNLDQRINLRRQHHKKQQLILNGNLAIHEDMREYRH